MKRDKFKAVLSLILAAAMAIPSNELTSMMNIGTVFAEETENEEVSVEDDELIDVMPDEDGNISDELNSSSSVENVESVQDFTAIEENVIFSDSSANVENADASETKSGDASAEKILTNTETEEEIDASLELSFVEVDVTDELLDAFHDSEAVQADTLHIQAKGANYHDTEITMYFWDYECDDKLPETVEEWPDYIVSASESILFYDYQEATDSIILEMEDGSYLELKYDEQWQDELHLTTELSFILPQDDSISADLTIFSSEDTMIEVVADDSETIFYADIQVEKQDETEEDLDDDFNDTDPSESEEDDIFESQESEISEEIFEYESEMFVTDEIHEADDSNDIDADDTSDAEIAVESEYVEIDYDADFTADIAADEPDVEFTDIGEDADDLFTLESDFTNVIKETEDETYYDSENENESEEFDDLFDIDIDMLEAETDESDFDFIEMETEGQGSEMISEPETEEELYTEAESEDRIEEYDIEDETEIESNMSEVSYTEQLEVANAIGEEIRSAENDSEEIENYEDESVDSYIHLSLLNDYVHIDAYNADVADSEIRLYFWDYNGELDDDKETWAEFITGPYDISNGEELVIADLPVTLSDGTVGSAHVSYVEEDNDSAYIKIEFPANSSIDVNLALDIEDNVIIKAVLNTETDMLLIDDNEIILSETNENGIADDDNNDESSEINERDEEIDNFDAAISAVGYDVMPLSVVSDSDLWWFDDYYVGTSDLYYVEETDDFSLKYQLEFHASENLEKEAVQIVIPASIGIYRDGSYILPSDIGVPYGIPENATETKSTPFNYYYADANGNVVSDPSSYSEELYIVFWNYKQIDSGTNVMFQVLYQNIEVMQVPDGTNWNNTPEISVTHNDETETKEGYTLYGNIDTEVVLTSVTKTSYLESGSSYTPELYTQYQVQSYIDNTLSSQYSGSNFDNYIYLLWKVVVKGTATQEWTLNITEETFAGSLQGNAVGYKFLGSSFGYRNYTHSVSSDGTQYTVGSSTDTTINTAFYVVTAYDREQYEALANGDNESVSLNNTVIVTAVPYDQIDPDITKQASASTTWGEYQWVYQGDWTSIYKWTYDADGSTKKSSGSYSPYKELYEINSTNDKDTSDFHFLSGSDGYGYSMTHVLPIENSDGSVSMRSDTGDYIEGTYYQMITYDDILYVYPNGSTTYGQALTKNDYYFDSIKITVNDYGYDVWEDKKTTCETINDVDQSVYIYAMFFDSSDWEYVGKTSWNTSGKMTYTFSDSDIAREPYRIKVMHNGVGYESLCEIDLYVALRPNAPTIENAIAAYESEYESDVTYLNIENIDGLSEEQFLNNQSAGFIHNQDIGNGNYSEYDSRTGETLEDFTRNLYGFLLTRNNAYVKLTGLETQASSSKSVTLENDTANERVLANYYLTAYEGYYVNSQSVVNQLKDAGLSLPDRNEVVYYDLLPYGMEFNASAGVTAGRLTSISGTSWKTNSRAWDSSDVRVTFEDNDIIPDWNGTGRTLIKFHIHYSNDDASVFSKIENSSNGLWFEGFAIYFQAYYDWSMINEVDSQYNIAAYIVEDSTDDLLGEHNSEVYKDDGSYNGSSSYDPFKISDLNDDGVTDKYTNMYARAKTSTNVATSSTSSIDKKVRADADIVADYSDATAVGLEQGYTYQISVTNFGSGTLSGIVVYDNLEYAVEDGRTDEAEKGSGVFEGLSEDEIKNYWNGYFNGLSIDALTDLGIDVILYYNENRNATISEDDLNTPADVLNESNGWYKSEDWTGELSDVKAIAVDISHYTNGNEVKLDSGESLAFDIHMISPDQFDSEKIYAFNNSSFYSVNTSLIGESTASTDTSNAVRIELADVGEVEVIKKIDGDIPSQMSNAKFTFVLTRKGDILPNQEYLLYTLDGDDWIDSGNVYATDINGEFTLKADQKAVFYSLADYDDVDIQEIDSVFWYDEIVQNSNNDSIVFTCTNTYRSPVYFHKTALTTDLATEEELSETEFTFTIYVDTNGDGTYELYSNGLYAFVSEVLTDGSSPEILGYSYTSTDGKITIGLNDIIVFFPIDQDGNTIGVDYQIIESDVGDDWIVDKDTVTGTSSVYGKSSTITNYYKYRSLIITKELTYYDNDIDECQDEWTFKITDENGEAVTGNHWYMIDENGESVLSENENPIEGYLDENGEFTFSGAGNGRKVVIERLISGEEYTVTETNYDDALWESMGDGVYTMPEYSAKKTGTITNKYLPKDLSVSKLVLSSDTQNSDSNDVEFTFRLEKLRDDGEYEQAAGVVYMIDDVEYKTDDDGKFVLKNNQTALFDDIGYEHDEYRITETADDTYWQVYPANGDPYDSVLGVNGDSVRFINGDFEDVASVTKTLEGVDDVGMAYTEIVKDDSQERTLTYVEPTVPFAVYSSDNDSLTFYAVYSQDEIPTAGSTYKGKIVTNVYTGFDTNEYSSSNTPPWYSNRTNFSIVTIDRSFSGIQPIATAYWFYGFTKCSRIDGLKYLNMSSVVSMYNMFYNCKCSISLDLSGWDTSNVTNMNGVFGGCNFTSLNLSGWDTSEVTDMSSMFYSSGLDSLDMSGWDTSNVTDMSYMFSYFSCSSTLELSGFDTSSVTTMTRMFAGCSLTTLDLSGFDTSNVTKMNYMFGYCTNLTSLNVSHFDTTNVTNMDYMFYDCTSLTTLDVSSFNTENLDEMIAVFYYCTSLTSLDVSGFDTSSIIFMDYLFRRCSELTTIYSDDSKFVTSQVVSADKMFTDSPNLVGGNGTTYDSSKVTQDMAHVDTDSNPGYFTDVSEKPEPSNVTQESTTVPKTNSAFVDPDDVLDTENLENNIIDSSIVSDIDQFSNETSNTQIGIQDKSIFSSTLSYYENDYQEGSSPSTLSLTYDNDPTLSGVYTVPITIGVYDLNGTLVTDEEGELTSFTSTSDYTFIYSSQDGTVELYDYNGGLLNFTIYPYDYVYVAGLSNGKTLKIAESDEMSSIIYATESETSTEIGSSYILSEGKVMTGTASANESIVLVNAISTANLYSEIYKLMTENSYEVPTGSKITFRVEIYNESSDLWSPANGIRYIMLDGYTGKKNIDLNAVSSLLETGTDGKIVLTKTDNGYPYIRFVDDEVYANVWTGMSDGQLRIVELADETDEDWGWLAGYDGTGWVNGSVLDVYYADTFIDANYLETTTGDNPAIQNFEVEKYMEYEDDTEFIFQLKEITAVSHLPVTSTSDILSSVIGANVFYIVYDTETGERISSGYTDSNGKFTLKAGQYAVFDVPDGTSWIVNELLKTGYELVEVVANTSEVPEATVIDDVNGAYQVESTTYLTHSIILTYEDSGSVPLEGGTFDLYKDGTLIQSGLVTDANGQIVVNELGSGEYYFVQTEAPDGYKIPSDANTKTVIIDKAQTRSQINYVYVTATDTYNVKYAVTIYGIYQDVDEDGHTLGLTFGPATGKSYIDTYDAHLTKEEYESGENGICLHWMSWAEIIEQSEKDATAFESCLKNGCTHSVELKLNDTLLYTDFDGMMDDGDGTGMLYYSINSEYLMWNGIWSNCANYGGWPASKIRANLNGKDEYTDTDNIYAAGGDYTLDSDHALISCFPTVLQETIIPKAVKSDTVSDNQTEEYNMTTYDKLWLLSGAEIYGGSGADVIRPLEGELYQRSELLGITTSDYADLISYYEDGNVQYWWLRSIATSGHSYAFSVCDSGAWYGDYTRYSLGMSPCFCLK